MFETVIPAAICSPISWTACSNLCAFMSFCSFRSASLSAVLCSSVLRRPAVCLMVVNTSLNFSSGQVYRGDRAFSFAFFSTTALTRSRIFSPPIFSMNSSKLSVSDMLQKTMPV